MLSEFRITPDTARQLESRRAELERQIALLREEHTLVCKQLEAVPLFLGMANGNHPEQHQGRGHDGGGHGSKNEQHATPSAESLSVPMAVKCVLQPGARLTAVEVREAVKALGVPAHKLGIGNSYLYTTLRRLQDQGAIQKVRGGKYQLPPGVSHQYVPSEEDLKP